MAVYKVFEIGEEAIEQNNLTTEKEQNIEEIIRTRGQLRLEINSVKYKLAIQETGQLIFDFNNSFFKDNVDNVALNNELNKFANKLLSSEQTLDSDGNRRRKKNITEGILFIKYTSEELTLLKLESLEIIDRTTYAQKQEYSTERDYFKLAIIKNNELNNIQVVDRNKKIAKYWAEEFLELTRQRDSYKNTEELLAYITNNKLVRREAFSSEQDFNRANKKVKNIIYEGEYHFNKEDIFQTISQDSEISFADDTLSSDELYTLETNSLDDDFAIDRDLVYQKAREKIKVSDEIIIDVKNFIGQKRANSVRLVDNEIRIRISDDLLEHVQELFNED